jgi:hypothetical protein
MSDNEVLSMFPALEGLKEILAEKDAEWSLRSKTLQQLQIFFSSQGPSLTSREKELLARYIRDVQPSISQHFAERRSALTREGCLAIAAAAEILFAERHFYEEAMPAFLSVLLKQLVITIKVISESAHRAIISMLKACGGSGLHSISSVTLSSTHHHHHHPLSVGIPVLCEGIAASHPQVRSKSAEYIGVILDTKNAIHLPHEMLEAIEASLTKALTDAAPEARSNARKAQPSLQKIKAAVGLPSGPSSSSSSASTLPSSAQATSTTITALTSSSSAPISAPVLPFSLPFASTSASASVSASTSIVPQTTNSTSVSSSVPRSLFGSGPQRILKKMTASTSTTTTSSTAKPGSFFSSNFSSHFTSLAVQPSISASAPVPASALASAPAPAPVPAPAPAPAAPASVPASAPVISGSSTSTPTAPLVPSTNPVTSAVRPFSYATPVVAPLPPATTTTTILASVAISSDSIREFSSSSTSSAGEVSSISGSAAREASSSSSTSSPYSAEEVSSSHSVGEDLAWAIENIAGIVDELCRGVEHPNKATTLPALADLGKFIYLHGRSLDTITLPSSSSSMASTLAERILPVLLRILAENPPSAQEEERAGAGAGEPLVSSLSSAAMVALEMVMARLPSCYLLPLFLRVCLKNVKTSSSSSSSSSVIPNNLALVTAQFCLECIVQLLPFSNPFFGDSSSKFVLFLFFLFFLFF